MSKLTDTPNDLTLPQIFARFPDETSAISYLEELRWEGTIVCPHCGNDDQAKFWTVAQEFVMNRARLRPSIISTCRLWPCIRDGQHQASLRPRSSDKERATFIFKLSPKRLSFDTKNNHGIEFETFAFVNRHDPNAVPDCK